MPLRHATLCWTLLPFLSLPILPPAPSLRASLSLSGPMCFGPFTVWRLRSNSTLPVCDSPSEENLVGIPKLGY